MKASGAPQRIPARLGIALVALAMAAYVAANATVRWTLRIRTTRIEGVEVLSVTDHRGKAPGPCAPAHQPVE